jgi:8-oxo-dGTP pyrophosphatase MutT (NUDIX family)
VFEVVVAGVLIEEGRVLLCHRSRDRKWYPNVWDLPGGHVEPGESLAQALKRELFEELGVTLAALSPEPFDTIRTSEFEMSVWGLKSWLGTPRNRLPGEYDRIAWFDLSNLESVELAHPAYPELLRLCTNIEIDRGR